MLCLELLPGASEAGRPCAEAALAQLRWNASKSSVAFCRKSCCRVRASALLSRLCTHAQPAMHQLLVKCELDVLPAITCTHRSQQELRGMSEGISLTATVR